MDMATGNAAEGLNSTADRCPQDSFYQTLHQRSIPSWAADPWRQGKAVSQVIRRKRENLARETGLIGPISPVPGRVLHDRRLSTYLGASVPGILANQVRAERPGIVDPRRRAR